MTPLKAVTLTTPDGVSRELRDTPGARKMIFDLLGHPNFVKEADAKGDWVLFEVAWCMMHDQDGEPPRDLPLKKFMFTCSQAMSSAEILAAIMSAVSNGAKSKNDLEALIKEAQEMRVKSTGSASGLSVPSASDSPTINSGGATLGSSSPPESSATASGSEEKIVA